LDREDNTGAIRNFGQALELARRLGDKSPAAAWLNDLAIASINLGDYDAADRYNREALQLKAELHESLVFPRVNEARIAAGRHNSVEAEKLFRAILADPSDDPTPKLEAHSVFAQLLATSGQFTRADEEFRSAIGFVEQQRAKLTRDEH